MGGEAFVGENRPRARICIRAKNASKYSKGLDVSLRGAEIQV